MAKLTLQIVGNNADALNKIEVVKAKLAEIGKSPVKLNVEASGLDAIQKALTSLERVNQDQAKTAIELANAEARKAEAIAKSTSAAARETQAQAKKAAEERKSAESARKAAAAENEKSQAAQKAAAAADNAVKRQTEANRAAADAQNAARGVAQAEQQRAEALEHTSNAVTKVNGEWVKTVDTYTRGVGQQVRITEQLNGLVDEQGNKLTDVTQTVTQNYEKQRIAAEKAAEAERLLVRERKELADSNAVERYNRQVDEIAASHERFLASMSEQADSKSLGRQWSDALDEMGRGFKSAEESARAFMENGLTPYEKELNTAAVNAGRLTVENAKIVDSVETWKDGQLVKAVDTYRDSLGNVTRVTSELNGTTARTTMTVKEAAKTAEDATNARNDLANATEKSSKAADGAVKATESSGKALDEYGKKVKSVSKLEEVMGNSLGNIFVKMTAWQVMGTVVATVIRSFKEAVQTMQAVDDKLVQVRKVTGMGADTLKELEAQAYRTASAYGVAADEYLDSVAAFARAGYKEQSAALAELSTKVQLVGDVSAETANQFLLSVDAAYKLGGNVEALSRVLDGANEIDNKYATSIERIAEGLGTVAPVAAQMHVSVEELTAAIGTITAVTQRSGSEAARALRALMLNIVGDTKTEIDEGVTWTTGEIAGLRDVIKTYAPEAYKAAEATGAIIDPMEAIGGLAQAMKDGLLTEQELMETVSDISGKMRVSQLLSLIQHWDMYKSMLEDFGGAAGSADREVENALDGWTRKTQMLKNAWTELLTNLVDTRAVKDLLDTGYQAVTVLDDAVRLTGRLDAAIEKLSERSDVLKNLFGSAEGALNPVRRAIDAVEQAVDWLYNTVEGKAPAVEIEYDAEILRQFQQEKAELDAMNEKLAENKKLLADAEKAGASDAYLNRLRSENAELGQQAALQAIAAEAAQKKADAEARAALTEETYRNENDIDKSTQDVIDYTGHLVELARTTDRYDQEIIQLLGDINALKEGLDLSSEGSRELNDRITQLNQRWIDLRSELDETSDALAETGEAAKTAARQTMTLQEAVKYLAESAQPGLQALSAAFSDVEKNGAVSVDTFGKLGDAFQNVAGLSGYLDRLSRLRESGEAVEDVLSDMTFALFNSQEAAAALTASTHETVAALLRENGVANADQVAVELLAAAKIRAALASDDLSGALAAGAAAADNEADAAAWAAMQTAALALQESIVSGKPIDTSGAIASLSGLAGQSINTAAALSALIQVFNDVASIDASVERYTAQASSATGRSAQRAGSQLAAAISRRTSYDVGSNFLSYYNDALGRMPASGGGVRYGGGGSGGGGGGGGGGKTPEEERLDALKSELALLEKQYDYNKELGASREELFEIIDKIDAKELEIAQHVQNTHAGYEGNAEILADLLDIERERYDWAQKRKALVAAEHETDRTLWAAQIQFLEASGGSEEERLDLIRRQKDSLHQQAEDLRALGATEDDLLDVRTEWWELDQKEKALLDEIIQKEKRRYTDAASAEKDRLEFLEASGQSQQAQIDQMRTIQAALHEQAEYLRSIGAEEAEINALSKEWWDWQNKILAKEKEIADALEQEIQARYDAIVEKVRGLAGVQSQALSLLKEYGADTDVILAKYGDYLDAQLQELEYLNDTDTALTDQLALAESWLKLKKEAAAYEKEAADDSAARAAKEKEENDYLSAVVSMRKSELSLIKARGDGEAAEVEKLREIQEALRREAEYLTSTLSAAEDVNAVQEKINALAVEWYGYERDILELEKELAELRDEWSEAHKSYLSDVVALRESELSLLKALGSGDDELIAKDREIQAAVTEQARFLEQQLEALKASGAAGEELADAQRELNSLAEKYLGLEQDILKIQQERLDAIKDETDAWLDEMEEAMRSPLEEQLKLLEEQWNARKEARTEEEKLLAVEKARIALENAQRQRTVRTYNAATGQWEWIANQKTVKSALDALDKANEDLNEYYAQKDYERAVAALELQIDYTEEAFDALRESLDYVAKKIKAGEMTYKEAYAYIQSKMKSIYDRYGVELRKVMDGSERVFEDFTRDMGGVMDQAVSRFEGVSGEINAAWRHLESIRNDLGGSVISFGKVYTALDESAYHLQDAADALALAAAGFGSANSAVQRIAAKLEESANDVGELPRVIQNLLNKVTSTAGSGAAAGVTQSGTYDYRQETGDLMRENALGWWASTGAQRSAYASANQSIGTQAGYNYDSSSGTWTDRSGGAAFAPLTQAEIDAAVIAKMKQNSAAWFTAGEAEKQSLANENYQLGTQRGWWRGSDGYWYDSSNRRVYDSGGVLRGTGGVKATAKDEMVLGPGLTEKTLEPETLRGFGEFADSLETVADAAGDGRLAETFPVSAEGVDFSAGAEQTRRSLPGVVFSGASPAGFSLRGAGGQSIGTQHNGDVIQINGLDLSNHVSRGTTIGELADLARNLGIRG